jgi:hypothetical protein
LLDAAVAEEDDEQPQTSQQHGIHGATAENVVPTMSQSQAEIMTLERQMTVVEMQTLRQHIRNGREQIGIQERALEDLNRTLDNHEQIWEESGESIEDLQQELATIELRMRQIRDRLEAERGRSDAIEGRIIEMTRARRHIREDLQTLRRELRQDRRRQAAGGSFARVFGTREDIQSDDYVSPITNMFRRVSEWGRRQPLQSLSQPVQAEASAHTGGITEGPPEESENSADLEIWELEMEARARMAPEDRERVFSRPPAASREAPAREPSDRVYMTTRGPMRNGQPLPPSEAEAYYRDPDESRFEEAMRTLSPAALQQAHGPMRHRQSLEDVMRMLAGARGARAPSPKDSVRGLDIADERPAPKTDAEMVLKAECKICMTQIADTACLPCGHLSMCSWCADQAIPVKKEDRTRPFRKGLKCPVCRDTVKSRVKIFVA